jgi:hypothetical protein
LNSGFSFSYIITTDGAVGLGHAFGEGGEKAAEMFSVLESWFS